MTDFALQFVSYSGFLNVVTRPFGGYFGDTVYKRYGTKGKKYLMLICGLIMGVAFLAGGLYLQSNHAAPHTPTRKSEVQYSLGIVYLTRLPSSVATIMGVFSLAAIFSEVGNGANFALVPHCNPNNNVSFPRILLGQSPHI